VHEPARLAILTALDACRHADFMYPQSLTGLAKGNLSEHLAKLEEASLISLTRSFSAKCRGRLTPDYRRSFGDSRALAAP
jgi:DNA-binding transcriptional ArsR family regulator